MEGHSHPGTPTPHQVQPPSPAPGGPARTTTNTTTKTTTNTTATATVSVSGRVQTNSAIATSRRILLEVFSLCVHGHTYRMKYFIMRNNVISRALRVLRAPHRHLHVSAIKFLRAILATKDEFYHRHIVKLDLLKVRLARLDTPWSVDPGSLTPFPAPTVHT